MARKELRISHYRCNAMTTTTKNTLKLQERCLKSKQQQRGCQIPQERKEEINEW